MTPAARLAAAAEIFAAVMAGEQPADRILHLWGRQRRYAGGGDRRHIREIVYAALRRRASLAWELWGPASSAAAADHRLIPFVAAGHDPAQLDALCGSGGHAPAALDPAERQALADRAAGRHLAGMPFSARMNIPAFLEGRFRYRFGAAVEAALEALNARAPADFRVNPLHADRDTVLARLRREGHEADPLPLPQLAAGAGAQQVCLPSWAIRMPMPLPRDHALLRDGTLVPQDAASQLAAALVDARPGHWVLDLCAGAGGKTLALAAAMAGQGRLIASDAAADRLARLAPRLEQAGLAHTELAQPGLLQAGMAVETTSWPPPADLRGRMDRVLVDAPCSGTGTWRRAPEDRWRLTEARLAGLRAIQHELLDLAAPYLRPGGVLVYATCSLLPEEGEEPVLRFLGRRLDFAPLAADTGNGRFRCLAPHSDGTDGFFIARLARTEDAILPAMQPGDLP